MATVAQWLGIFIVVTFILLVLPAILVEFLPPSMNQQLETIRTFTLVNVMGYSEAAAKFPTVIFDVLVPFGISLAAILILMSWMQKSIFPNVTESIFFVIGWLMALLTTRFFGPVISVYYTQLGLYGTIAFGTMFIISIALAMRRRRAGLWTMFITWGVSFVLMLVGLFVVNFIGVATLDYLTIVGLSLVSSGFMLLLVISYAREALPSVQSYYNVAQKTLKSIEDEIAHLQEKEKEAAEHGKTDLVIDYGKKIRRLQTEAARIEERERKVYIEGG